MSDHDLLKERIELVALLGLFVQKHKALAVAGIKLRQYYGQRIGCMIV